MKQFIRVALIVLIFGTITVVLLMREANDDAVKNLPETSAIRKSLELKKEAEEMTRKEHKRRDVEMAKIRRADELLTGLGVKYAFTGRNDVPGRMYRDGLLTEFRSYVDFYPLYHVVCNKRNVTEYEFFNCVIVNFAERVERSAELQQAFLIAKHAGVTVYLNAEFTVSIGGIRVDINTSDESIIQHLTEKRYANELPLPPPSSSPSSLPSPRIPKSSKVPDTGLGPLGG